MILKKPVGTPIIFQIAGLIIVVSSVYAGYDSTYQSIAEGTASRHWPTTQGASYSSRVSAARLPWWPRDQMLFSPYYYQVNGIASSSARYDVQGPFVGSPTDIDEHLRHYPSRALTVYYNPSNPNQSVLKPGIAFNFLTKLYFVIDGFGLLLILLGAAGSSVEKRET